MHFHCPLHVAIFTPNIIILDSETSNLPSRKLQPLNAYMYETRNNFKKDIRLHLIVKYIFGAFFYTCKLVKYHRAAFHQGMPCLLR